MIDGLQRYDSVQSVEFWQVSCFEDMKVDMVLIPEREPPSPHHEWTTSAPNHIGFDDDTVSHYDWRWEYDRCQAEKTTRFIQQALKYPL